MSALVQSEHVSIDQNFKRINGLSATLCMAECRNGGNHTFKAPLGLLLSSEINFLCINGLGSSTEILHK
jgi:hypothetical protein